MTSAGRRRLVLVLSLGIAAGALGLLASGVLGRNIVYYWTPTELVAAGEKAHGARIRLGGMVSPGSVTFDEATHDLRFRVHDEANEVIVHQVGTPPEMFRKGIGAVVEGTLGPDGTFEASRLLVKHSEEYRAPEDGKHASDPLRTVEETP